MVTTKIQDAFLNNCLAPYICSFLNATDLILSRSVCSSWKNVHEYATYWIQNKCIPSSLLTKMVAQMTELIYCDVDVVSEGKSWDLIIYPHQKLTYLKIKHIEDKKWHGGNCKIGPMAKLRTLEIHEAKRSAYTMNSKFDCIVLETPKLDKLIVYNFTIPDYCIPSSISQLKIRTRPVSFTDFEAHRFHLEHCTSLLYVWCEASLFESQMFEFFSQTAQFGYCDSNFRFHFPNLKWLCIKKLSMYAFFEFEQHYLHLEKLFVISNFIEQSFVSYQRRAKIHRFKLLPISTRKRFEMIVEKKLCE